MRNTLLLILFLPVLISAQDPRKMSIMMSDDYYWGKAEAVSAQEAKTTAVRNLINSVVTYIFNENTDFKSETATGDKSGFESASNVYIKTFSQLRIRNLNYIEEKNERLYSALAYVLKSDFSESLSELENEIGLEYRSIRKREEKEGSLQTMNDLYLLYLKTFFSPTPVPLKDTTGITLLPNLALEIKNNITSLLSGIQLKDVKAEKRSGENAVFEIRFSYGTPGSKPADIYFTSSQPGSAEIPLSGGKASFFYDGLPSDAVENMKISLAPYVPKNNDFYSLHRSFGISVRRDLRVDFSEYTGADFSYMITSAGDYVFTPVINGISVASLRWEFEGGAASSDDPRPSYRPAGKQFTVKLTVNNSAILTTTKLISGEKDKVIVNTPPVKTEENKNTYNAPPPAKEETKTVPPAHNGSAAKSFESEITSLRGYEEIISFLNAKSAAGIISFGNKKDFRNPDLCHVAMIDPSARVMTAFLSPSVSGSRRDLLSDTLTTHDDVKFKGFAKIWILLLQK